MSPESMTRDLFEYAVIRLIPRVERGEQINVGVVLYCQRRDFLAARTHLDQQRVRALDPTVDLAAVHEALRSWEHTCREGTAGGEKMRPGECFRWLTAPRSTILQAGPVHTGLTADPAADVERLLTLLVR